MTFVDRALRRVANGLLAGVAAAALVAAGSALAIDSLKILVPAAPGGGWDQTGRALQAAMQSDKHGARRSPSTTRAAPAARSASRSS